MAANPEIMSRAGAMKEAKERVKYSRQPRGSFHGSQRLLRKAWI
jgi:hypothetical protein